MNEKMQALGRLGRGVKKNLSPKQREAKRSLVRAINARRASRIPQRWVLAFSGGKDSTCLLHVCKELGYTWGGLYEWIHRPSCWCCPMMRKEDTARLVLRRPELWEQASRCPGVFKRGLTAKEYGEKCVTDTYPGLGTSGRLSTPTAFRDIPQVLIEKVYQ